MIPDDLEPTLTHGNPPYPYSTHSEAYNPELFATHADHFGYGYLFSDSEDHAMHYQEYWEVGSANRKDWAYPGKQWS
jgi:hypothetical protein